MPRSRGSGYRVKESGSSCSDAFSTAASSSSAPQGSLDAVAVRPDRRALRERLREERAADDQVDPQDAWGAWQKPKAESSSAAGGRWKGKSSSGQQGESWEKWDKWDDWPADSKSERSKGERRRGRWKGPMANLTKEDRSAPASGSWDKWKGVSAAEFEKLDTAAESNGSWAKWKGVTAEDAAGIDAEHEPSSGSWAKWKGVAAEELVADLERAKSKRGHRRRRRRRGRGPRRQARFQWTQVGVQMAEHAGLSKVLGFPAAGDAVTLEQLSLASDHGLKVPVLLELHAMIKKADDEDDDDAGEQEEDDDDDDGPECEQDDEGSDDDLDLDHEELGAGYWLGVGYNNDGGDSDEELGDSDSSSEKRAPQSRQRMGGSAPMQLPLEQTEAAEGPRRPSRSDGVSLEALVLEWHSRQDDEDLDPEEALDMPQRKTLLQAGFRSELEHAKEQPTEVGPPPAHEPLLQQCSRPSPAAFHVPSAESAYGNVASMAHPWPDAGSRADTAGRPYPAAVRGVPMPSTAPAVAPMRSPGPLLPASKSAEDQQPWSSGGTNWREEFSLCSSWPNAPASAASAAAPAAGPMGGIPMRNLHEMTPQRAPNTFASCPTRAPAEAPSTDLGWFAPVVSSNPSSSHFDQNTPSRQNVWNSAQNVQLAPRREPWPAAPQMDVWPAPRRESWAAALPAQETPMVNTIAGPLLAPTDQIFPQRLSAWPSDASARVAQTAMQQVASSWEVSSPAADVSARAPRPVPQHGQASWEPNSRGVGASARFAQAGLQHAGLPWEAVLPAQREQSMSSTAVPFRAEHGAEHSAHRGLGQSALQSVRDCPANSGAATGSHSGHGLAVSMGSEGFGGVPEQYFLPQQLTALEDSDEAELGPNEDPHAHLSPVSEFECYRRMGLTVRHPRPWEVRLAEAPQSWLRGHPADSAESSPEPWYNRAFLLMRRPDMGLSVNNKRNRRKKKRGQAVITTEPRPPAGIGNLPQARAEDCYGLVADLTTSSMAIQIDANGGQWCPPDHLDLSSLQVADFNEDPNTGVLNLVWRMHCVGLKSLPPVGQSKFEPNHLHIHGETGILNRTKFQHGVLEVHLQTAKGRQLQVQAGCCRSGGARCVQRILLTDAITLCVGHRRPVDGLACLCPEAIVDAVDLPGVPVASQVSEWESTADYVAAWKPLVELEAATCAVQETDSRILFDVEIKWQQKRDRTIMGSFEFDTSLCSAHGLRFRNIYDGQDGPSEWASGWLCLRRIGTGANTTLESWSGHAAIVHSFFLGRDSGADYSIDEDDWSVAYTETRMYVVFRLIVPASDLAPLAEQQANGGEPLRGYVAEFLPKMLAQTHQARALMELGNGSKLLKEFVLSGRSPAKPAAPVPSGSAAAPQSADAESLSPRSVGAMPRITEALTPLRLHPPQEAAISCALEESCLLIHGPPGTGKTRTAASLAVLFALRNARAGSPALVLYAAPNDDAADVACLRVNDIAAEHFERLSDIQVSEATDGEECVICLNGACDVITRCGHMFHAHCLSQALEVRKAGCPLCRQHLRQLGESLNTLRVYSSDVEQLDFPVPRRINHPSVRQRKPRAVPEYMRKHALHWRCHAMAPDVAPTEEAKKAGQAYQQLCRSNPGDLEFDKYHSEYYSALRESWAAEVQRADIIFATCIASGRAALASAFGEESDGSAPVIKQVILDDAGQSTEPETLCPLTIAKAAEHIVLVGDSKQFRPTVQDHRARQLGLDVSLFRRLSERTGCTQRYLTLQHRMHPEINAFPSAYFHAGALCSDALEVRPLGLLEHPQQPSQSTALFFWASSESPGEQTVHVQRAEAGAAWRYPSCFNEPEARVASKTVTQLAARVGSGNVAVLSWYNAQVTRIGGLLHGSGIHVGSVVSAQGSEWDYVVLSTVRSAPGRLGSLADAHVLQLALTRARCGLCVLGHPETLRGIPAWKAFIEHSEERGVLTVKEPQLVQGTPSA